jgi:hypothetical protein
MIIDENTFQLHPNNPGEPPAEMEFTIELSGQKQFSTRISDFRRRVRTQDVIFSVTMSNDGIAFAEERQVGPGQMVDWIFSTFPRVGRHRVLLSTRMLRVPKTTGGGLGRVGWLQGCDEFSCLNPVLAGWYRILRCNGSYYRVGYNMLSGIERRQRWRTRRVKRTAGR